jgi:peptide chain release factor subunit 3
LTLKRFVGLASILFWGLNCSLQVDVAEPGDNVRMKVKGIEEEDLRYGFVMCPKDNLVQGCRYFDAKVNILEYKSIICPGYISVMHIHAATEEVAIMHLLATLDKKGQILEKKPKFVKQGQVSLSRDFCVKASALCRSPFFATTFSPATSF